jgi:predicted Zn-dependent protease
MTRPLIQCFFSWRPVASALGLVLVLTGCPMQTSQVPPGSSAPTARQQSAPEGRHLDPQQAERLKAVMTPLLLKMNHPIPLDQVRIGLMDDSHINAANAGGGEFYVTTGLLLKANDEQLAGVLAHEVAHADLGHVTKLETIGTGTNIAAVLLDAFGVPGAGLVPLAGDLLIARPYSRDAEYAADRHGAELLQLTGRDGKRIMATTLTWLMQAEGAGGGGFFATHPSTDDRIERVQASANGTARKEYTPRV